MKRLDNKTCNLMNRFVLPLLFGALLIAPVLSNFAAAKDSGVQQWMQTSRATITINPKLPAGDVYADKIAISNVASDIRFDPRNLKDSRLMFGATFMPADPSSSVARKIEPADGSGFFESQSIKQTSDTTFDVVGQFKMGNYTQPLSFPLTVSYAGNSAGQPVLVFSGEFTPPLGTMMPALGVSRYVPLAFSIETAPAP